METFDIVIRNATVIDGTRRPRYGADVGVRNGRIERIGDLAGARAATVLDAEDRIVAPGFVDNHTHYDAQIFWDPTCSNAGENGITTVVMGNCGFGFAPVRPQDRDRAMIMMETTEQVPATRMRHALPWSWESLPELVTALERTPKAVNCLMFMPLNLLMMYVMGVEAAKTRRPTPGEIGRMKALLHEAMNAGACGLSLTWMGRVNNHVDIDGTPVPTDIMSADDACEIASVLRERGDGIIECISQIGPYGDRSISERLARETGRPVLHNVFSVSDLTPDLHLRSMDWLTKLNAEGVPIWAETVVTRAWNEVDLFNSPGSALDALDTYRELTVSRTREAKRAKLLDPDFCRRFRETYDPVMFEATGGDIRKYVVIGMGKSANAASYLGRSLGEIAGAENKAVTDVFVALALESDLEIELRTPGIASNPKLVAELLSHPNVLAGTSDGGAHTKNFSGGQWTTDLLLWLTQEHALFSLEEMHYRLSAQPAAVIGLKDRGILAEGMAADLVVYSPDELYIDQSHYLKLNDQPGGDWRRKAKAGGYRWIIVNGRITFDGDKPTGATPGTYLRVTGDAHRLAA